MNKLPCIKLLLISILLFNINYITNAQNLHLSKSDLDSLQNYMNGQFSSEEQSKNDTDYYHIRLAMKPIWQQRKDGYWFYVEQALATALNKPYRQRVYHLFLQGDTVLVSQVYEMPNPLQYAGGFEDESKMVGLTIDSLIDRKGCAIYLHKKKENVYEGSTPGKLCLSSLRGATYATSEVSIYPDKIISWDRGWDKDDKQVWGAEKGGYLFNKIIKH